MMKFFLIFKKLLFTLFTFIIFFILCDLLFSNFIYNEKNQVRYDCFKYEYFSYNKVNYNDYYLDKNCTATEKQRTVIPYKVITDQNGYRYSGKERSPNSNNLVFLGDSFTYGYGVKYENSFPGLLENMIKDHNIYNLGVPGYGLQKYYHTLSNFFKKNQAKKIFLTMDMTDVADASFRWTFIPNSKSPVVKSKKVNNEIDKWKKIKNSNFKGTRLITFHLRNFARYIKIKLKSKESDIGDAALSSNIANFTYLDIKSHTVYNKENFLDGIENIETYFKKISNLAKLNNSELYLIIFPWPENLIHGQEEFNWENFSSTLCKKNHCSGIINLFPDFEKIKDKKVNWKNTIYIKDDVHLKKFGNNLIAKKIIKILTQ